MKAIRKKKFILILFLVWAISLIRVPVYAATLSIDGEEKTIGQTIVTARVENPDEFDNSEKDNEEIPTGDKTRVLNYLGVVLLSGVGIIGILWKKDIDKERI